MKKPIGKLAAVAGAVVTAFALTAAPASAVPSTVWTVLPSPGHFTAVNSGNVVLTLNGLALTCGRSTASGQMNSADGNPAGVAVITTLTFGSCTSPLGSFSVTPALPWTVLAQDHTASTGVSQGRVGSVDVKLTVGACVFRVTGTASSTYTNATGRLAVGSLPGELTVVAATNCGGFVAVGAKPTFRGDYLVKVGTTIPTIVGTNP
ncbi:hypothetical protein [Streptomyces sp. NPDC058486]|uniref:hypothetical protein n=1 Tax=unclassified Streptomyces TaxID=2593676 RepID=UPI00364E1777